MKKCVGTLGNVTKRRMRRNQSIIMPYETFVPYPPCNTIYYGGQENLEACSAKIMKGTIWKMERKKIDRINELAKKSRNEELSPAEKEEQRQLREEYIKAVRKNFKNTLDNIETIDKPIT